MKQEMEKLISSIGLADIKNETLEMEMDSKSIDTEFKKEIRKVFNRTDLWNIHRQRKSRVTRRYF